MAKSVKKSSVNENKSMVDEFQASVAALTQESSVNDELTQESSVDDALTQEPSVDDALTQEPSVDDELTQEPSVDDELTQEPIDPIAATIALFPGLTADTLRQVLQTYEGFMTLKRAQEKNRPGLLTEAIRVVKKAQDAATDIHSIVGYTVPEIILLLKADPVGRQLPCFEGVGMTKDGKEREKTPGASLSAALQREEKKSNPRITRSELKGYWKVA